MQKIIEGAGIFIWPLGLFSFLAMYVIIERLLALRPSQVLPKALEHELINGDLANYPGDFNSVAGRIVYFFRRTKPEPDALKAFARLEIAKLERGLFILEIVIAGAPLLGLLGTITGLAEVFASQVVGQGQAIQNKDAFIQGISLALTTTMVGLCIAIPALVGNSYLHRRVDLLATKIEMCVERLISLQPGK